MKTKLSILALMGLLTLTASAIGKTNYTNENNRIFQNSAETDYQKFKREQEDKMRDNDKKIADIKAKMEVEDQSVKDKYEKKVAKIEEKNSELRKKLNDYRDDGNNTKWNAFKRDFSKSMDELGSSVKDLSKNYPK